MNSSEYYQKQFDEAYRPGVGAMLINKNNKVLICERIDSKKDAWQMPQGGIDEGETPEQAVLRELQEEVGTNNAEIIGRTSDWIYYDFPPHIVEKFGNQYRGQRQIWFALRFLGTDSELDLNTYETPEFKSWKWVDIENICDSVIHFKRECYNRIIEEFSPLLKK